MIPNHFPTLRALYSEPAEDADGNAVAGKRETYTIPIVGWDSLNLPLVPDEFGELVRADDLPAHTVQSDLRYCGVTDQYRMCESYDPETGRMLLHRD